MAKILGVFTVKSAQIKKIHLMLMENTLRVDHSFFSEKPHIFDLKGSRVDRLTGADSFVKKDIDFLNWKLSEDNKESNPFRLIHSKQMITIFRMLDRDVKYLSSMNLMDYSMLIGIQSTLS